MKKRDVLIVAAVVVVALLGMLAVRLLTPGPTQYARIYVQDRLYQEVPLDTDQVVEIDQGNGIVNHVEVKDGAIHMKDSTCDDKLCVEQGEITPENYEDRALRNWVVCLPNQVTIELVLADEG